MLSKIFGKNKSNQPSKKRWYHKVDTINPLPLDAGLRVKAFVYTRKRGEMGRDLRVSFNGVFSLIIRLIMFVITSMILGVRSIGGALFNKAQIGASKVNAKEAVDSVKEKEAKAKTVGRTQEPQASPA